MIIAIANIVTFVGNVKKIIIYNKKRCGVRVNLTSMLFGIEIEGETTLIFGKNIAKCCFSKRISAFADLSPCQRRGFGGGSYISNNFFTRKGIKVYRSLIFGKNIAKCCFSKKIITFAPH